MRRIITTVLFRSIFMTAAAVSATATAAAGTAALDARDSVAPGDPGDDSRADAMYERARNLIEEGKLDRAVAELNRLIALKSDRTDAAIYWKAYTLSRLGQQAEALEAVADLYKQFADSSWTRAAKALEVEVRQASGQPVSPGTQQDDELKLMALQGLMHSDPDQALPVLEKMLSSANSPRVKERALFVISQSRSSRARDLIGNLAKGNGNPDLQLKAIRYLGLMGGPDSRQTLADAYRSSNDAAVKRAILRTLMVAGDRERLLALAKSEPDLSLRNEAIRQLGVMHSSNELSQLYQTETSAQVRKSILQSFFVGGDSEKLGEIARNEKDPELRKTAIHELGMTRRAGVGETLTSIYNAETTPDVRKAVINALFLQNNATALVALARAEKSPDLKKDIVARLSMMKSKEATDYLLELLK